MNKIFCFLAVIFLFVSCTNKRNELVISILNTSLTINDSVKIKLENNTNENYLFYFKRPRFDYFHNSNNTVIARLESDSNPVEVKISSDPLYILNEDGTLDEDDQHKMKKYSEASNIRMVKIVPAGKSIIFSMKLIDTLNEAGGKEYPVLANNKSYTLTLQINMDSSSVERKELEAIRRTYNGRIFQGKLLSNEINLKSK